MTEILPGILENSFDLIKEKVSRLEGVVKKAQLDIADGIFVPEETWHNAKDLGKLNSDILFDLHLMVDRPEKWINEWNKKNIFRFTVHFEATYDIRRTIKIIRESNKKAAIALRLETPVKDIIDIIGDLDMVLFMSIEPGGQGRGFNKNVLDKIKELRSQNSKIKIGVDGGINHETAQECVNFGADVLVSGSYVFSQSNIKKTVKDLENLK